MVGLRHGGISCVFGAMGHPNRNNRQCPARIGALRLAYRFTVQNDGQEEGSMRPVHFGENEFHIVRSDTAAAELRECFGISHDRMLVDNDDPAYGPLAPYVAAVVWRAARRSFWLELPDLPDLDSCDNAPGGFPAGLEAEKERLTASDTVYLWLGPLLSEVLLLGFALTIFERLQIDPARLRLVDLSPIRSPLGVEPSIGGLSGEYLEQIGPWRSLDDGLRTAYKDIWLAVTDPAPDRLIGIGAGATYPDPVRNAARAYMAHYPSIASGLGFWEQLALAKCKDSRQKVVRIVADIFGDTLDLAKEMPDWPNDSWLFHRLKQMADPALPHPLVQIYGKGERMRRTEVNLTDAGRAVLAGEANAIALNGIEDRIGGVALSNQKHWLFDGETLVPASAEC
jgi:hypothetical protein